MDARVLVVVVGIVVAPWPADAQVMRSGRGAAEAGESASARVVEAVRLDGAAPVLDGLLEDAVWRSAQVAADFVQREPSEGAPASEPTEVRLAYDSETLYVAATLLDSRPDSISSVLARRDVETPSDELWVMVDSYNDRRTAFVFAVNPSGAKRDWLVYDGSRTDTGWDAVWRVETARDERGWTVEMAVPLNQLRFSAEEAAGGGEAGLVWGLNFVRRIARRNEYSNWSLIPQDAPEYVAYYGELRGLRLPDLPRRLEVVPYTLARATRAPVAAGDPFRSSTDTGLQAGADVKLGLTSDLTLSATINPDFGQVEADPSQVNLTANELFLPERRPFFVEGMEIFQAGFPQPFYSRRIGRAPQGRVTGGAEHVDVPATARILGAAKLSGKTAGGWSIGVLDAVTGGVEARWLDGAGVEGATAVEPATNYAVARVARDFRDGRSALGGMVTATNRRIDSPELAFLREAAYVVGLDGRHRFGGLNLHGNVMVSTVRGDTSAIALTQRSAVRHMQRPDASYMDYDPTRTSLSGWGGFARIVKESGNWRPGVGGAIRSPGLELNDLGFQPDADIRTAFAWIGYEQFRPGPVFRRYSVWVNQWNSWNFGGEKTGTNANFNANFQLRNFWEGRAGVIRSFARLDDGALRGGPALRRDGSTSGWLELSTDPSRSVTGELRLDGRVADADGGRSAGIGARLALRPSARAELSLEPRLQRNREGSQYVAALAGGRYVFGRLEQTTAALTARLSYTFSPALSLELYAQPFLSAGEYTSFTEVADPRAGSFDARFRPLPVTYDAVSDRYAAAEGDVAFGNPAFNVRELKSNAVLRWEYRPGSTLFVVWSQGRGAFERDGRFGLGRELSELWRAPGSNVLLLKLSYWMDG